MVPLGNELIAGLSVSNRPDGPNALRHYRVPLVQLYFFETKRVP